MTEFTPSVDHAERDLLGAVEGGRHTLDSGTLSTLRWVLA
jgi:hypothetical protein